MIANVIVDNLLTAPVLAFVVALLATLWKFDLRLPESLYPILSTYLLLAIGVKGGRALSTTDVSDLWKPLVGAIILGVVTPLIAFALLRVAGRVDPVFVDDIGAMPQAIADFARDGDVVIAMGAGSIGAVPQKVVELLGGAEVPA